MLDSGPRVELAESPASDGLPGVFRVTPSRYPQSMIESERARRWASTMEGHPTVSDIRLAHAGPGVATGAVEPLSRAEREAAEGIVLAAGATRAAGAGERGRPEEPDPLRTCIARDRDRSLPSTTFRRLARTTQLYHVPDCTQPTRHTNAPESAQPAPAVALAPRP